MASSSTPASEPALATSPDGDKTSDTSLATDEKDDHETSSIAETVHSHSRGDDSSSGSSGRDRSAERRRSGSRTRSILSRHWSRSRSRPASLADAPPITRTVSEVRDGVYVRRDVEIDGIEREEIGERAGLTTSNMDSNVDLERGVSTKKEAGSDDIIDPEHDPNLVKWDGPDDPENPKNWTTGRKWAAVFVVSLFTFISPVSSSMVAPALPKIGSDLHIAGSVEQTVTMTIFILAYAIGPLFLGPLSEMYGRVVVLQLSNLVYLFFNLGCALSRNRGEMIAFRFLSGFGGSAPLAIGGGVLADLFTAEQRGRALSMYSLAPLLGPAIGPIAGAFIVENTSWRWIFYATTIADGILQVGGLFLLRETYAPVLLVWKRNRLRAETGNAALYTAFDKAREIGTWRTLKASLSRPFILIATQPIVQVLALYVMYLYGLMYIMLATFPRLWADTYHERVGVAGLNYVALGVGFTIGTQVLAPVQDNVYAHLKRRYNVSVGQPEFRVPVMVPGAILVPVGLLIYGWCAENKVHWIGPDIGAAVMAMGIIVGFQCIQGYLVDTYTRYAASAVAATTVLRSMAGFGFPLFAPSLYARLGYGKGNTVLAVIGIVVGWPAPFLLWKFGPRLRAKKASFQG